MKILTIMHYHPLTNSVITWIISFCINVCPWWGITWNNGIIQHLKAPKLTKTILTACSNFNYFSIHYMFSSQCKYVADLKTILFPVFSLINNVLLYLPVCLLSFLYTFAVISALLPSEECFLPTGMCFFNLL